MAIVNSGKPCGKGHISARYVSKSKPWGECIACIKERNAPNREKHNAWHRKWNAENHERVLLTNVKARAKKYNLPFDLDADDIKIPELCPVLGVKLERSTGFRKNNNPSIDRIIPEKGYVKGNIIIVSWRANNIKTDASADELRKVADFYNNLETKTNAH